MKIGIYDPYLDDLGGGEKYMMKIAECLSGKHGVTVFWDERKDLIEITRRFFLNLSKVSLAPNIFSRQVGLIKRLWGTKKYDVIIFLSDGSIPLSFSGKLFIHLQQPMPGAKKSFKTRLKLARVNKVFCNSYFSKSYIDKSLGVDSLVIYPPVEINVKPVGKENIILHVGRFRPRDPMTGASDYKKQDLMTEVFKDMVEKGLKNWRFILAVSVREGEEGAFHKLKETARGFPIEFLVNKTNDELWEIYSRAKIYWHASGYGEDLEKHPEYAEHFGISTVEAMGAGAVPVVINAGGQKEIIEDGKSGFLWNDKEDLQKRTLQLINNEALMEKISKSAIERTVTFSGDRFCREIREMIEQ